MATGTYVHRVSRIEVDAPHVLERTRSYSRKITVTDERGDYHELILFADTREALVMPGDAPASNDTEAAEEAA